MTLEFFEMQKELFMAPGLKTYAGTTAERVTFAKGWICQQMYFASARGRSDADKVRDLAGQ